MIIWGGNGILLVLFWIIGFIIGSILGVMATMAVGGAAGSMLCAGAMLWCPVGMGWLYALTLGKTKVEQLIDPTTRTPVLLKKSHSLFFIPVFGWCVLATIASAVLMVKEIVSPSLTKMHEPAEASNSLHDAETWITSSKGVEVGGGNTPEATKLAIAFSDLVTEYRSKTIEPGSKSFVSLSGGRFLTWCQASPHGVAFVVHVPLFRKFSDGAKQTMCEGAWVAAQVAVSHLSPPPKLIAVGVRGAFLYESVMVGEPHGDIATNPKAGLSESLKDPAALHPFFQLFEAEPSPETQEFKAAQGPPTQSIVTEPPAASATEKPSASAPAPNNPAPTPTPTPPPPAASPPPPSSGLPTSATGPATPFPTAMREWKASDGRVLKASLVKPPDAVSGAAEFKREDGQVFTIPVDRFSVEDQAFIRSLNEAIVK